MTTVTNKGSAPRVQGDADVSSRRPARREATTDLSDVAQDANQMAEAMILEAASGPHEQAIAKLMEAKHLARIGDAAASTERELFRLSMRARDTIIGNMKA